MAETPSAESGAGREADVLIEAGHPSRPDREALMRQHIARMKAQAWDEGYLHAIEPESDVRDNPYLTRVTPPGSGDTP